jgi:hypothetical protein
VSGAPTRLRRPGPAVPAPADAAPEAAPAPEPACSADPGQRLAVYDLRVRTVVSPAFIASFPVPVRPTVVPRRSVYRFRVAKDRNIADVVRRLSRCGVDVLDIRVSSLPG